MRKQEKFEGIFPLYVENETEVLSSELEQLPSQVRVCKDGEVKIGYLLIEGRPDGNSGEFCFYGSYARVLEEGGMSPIVIKTTKEGWNIHLKTSGNTLTECTDQLLWMLNNREEING